MTGHPDVSVQIVTWHSAAVIEACLASLAEQTTRCFEVVVVDNASGDGTPSLVEAWRGRVPGLTLVCLRTNVGFCAGQNRATQVSAAPWVLLLNPDTVLPTDFMARAAEVTHRVGPRVGSVAPCLLRPDGSIDSTGLMMDRFRRAYDRDRSRPVAQKDVAARQVFGCTGAVALLRRSMLADVAVDGQPFEERIFAYYDDLDLAWRARLRGWSCQYEPDLTAWHHRAGRNAILALKGRCASSRDQALSVRNRLLVMARCDRLADLLLALPWLVPFELARIAYLLVRAPAVLAAYGQAAGELGAAIRARAVIRARASRVPLAPLPWRVR